MGVVQSDRAHPAEAADRTGLFVPVHRPEFADADRQVSIAAQLICVDEDVVRAVHRPQHQFFVLEWHRRKHAVAIVIPVSGSLVQIDLAEHGCVDVLVAGVALLLEDVLLEDAAHCGALREQQRQPRADKLTRHEQLEFATEFAMVAPREFFDPREVVVELLLRLEHRSVDALEHRPLLVAAPICAGDARQLERRHLPRPVDVRPLAEIDKGALLVDRNLLVGDAFDQLDFERLRRELPERFLLRHLAVLERNVRFHALPHA